MTKAEHILNDCGAVDIDEKVESWRKEGWTGGAMRAATGSTGTVSVLQAGATRKLQEVEEELQVGKRAVAKGGVWIFTRMTEVPVSVSWGAVFAGMVIAIVMQLVLSLLDAGLGLSTVDPLRYSTPEASTFGMGAGCWWVVSSVIVLFVGGWVAGHLSGSSEATDSALHGLLTWGLATIVTVHLMASLLGSVVRGGANVVGKTASVAAAGIGAAAGPASDMVKDQMAASGITLDSLKAQAQKLLAQTGNPDLQPGAIANQASAAAGQLSTAAAVSSGSLPSDDLQGALQNIISLGKSTVDQADKDSVINVVIARTGVSRAVAEQRVEA